MTADVYATVAEAIKVAHKAAMDQWRAEGGDVDGPSESVIRAAVAALAGMGDVTDTEIARACYGRNPNRVPAVRAFLARVRATDQARIAELIGRLGGNDADSV
jgi:hypothetical protein